MRRDGVLDSGKGRAIAGGAWNPFVVDSMVVGDEGVGLEIKVLSLSVEAGVADFSVIRN